MATVTKQWLFPTDAEGIADAGNSAAISLAYDSTNDCIEFVCTTKNITQTEFFRRATTGQTWQDWGVPAGATVTAVEITSWAERLTNNTKLNTHSIKMRVIGSGGASVHGATDLVDTALGTTVDTFFVAGPVTGNAVAVSGGSQASTTDVRLEIEYLLDTDSGGGGASVIQEIDGINLEITYVQTLTQDLGGAISASGALSASRFFARALAGAITSTGSLVKRAGKALAGGFGGAPSTVEVDYSFNGSAQGWTATPNAGDGFDDFFWDSFDGEFQGEVASSAAPSEFGGWMDLAVTWEDLGVPPGSIVTAVRSDGWVHAVAGVFGVDGYSGPMQLLNGSEGLRAELHAVDTYDLGLGAPETVDPGSDVSVPNDPSDTPIIIRLFATLTFTEAAQTGTFTINDVGLTVTYQQAGGGIVGALQAILEEDPTIHIGGTIAASAVLVRDTAKGLTGALSSAGSHVREARPAFAGSVAPSGASAFARAILRSFAGTTPTSGSLSKLSARGLTGSVASTGSLVRRPGKALAGALASVGSVAKSTARSFSGTVGNSGVLDTTRAILRSFGGTVASAGSAAKQTTRDLVGSIGPTGALVRSTARAFAGSIGSTASLGTIKALLRTFSGSMASSGSLTRRPSISFAGSVASTGSLVRRTATAFAGAVSSVASLVAFRPGQTFEEAFSGAIASAGAFRKQARSTFSGTAASVGTVARRMATSLGGAVAPEGSLIRSFVSGLGGVVASAGSLVRQVRVDRSGSIVPAGSLVKRLAKDFSAAISSAASLVAVAPGTVLLSLAGAISSAGSLTPNKLRSVIVTVARGVGAAVARTVGLTGSRSLPPDDRDRGPTGPRG